MTAGAIITEDAVFNSGKEFGCVRILPGFQFPDPFRIVFYG